MRFNLVAFNMKDEEEFRRWFETYSVKFFDLAFRFLRDRAEARSVVMEKMLQVFRRDTGFHNLSDLNAYTYRSVQNECIDRLKQRKRDRLFSAPLSGSEEVRDEIDMDREKQLEKKNEDLHRWVADLPNRTRQVIELLYYKGKTRQEVAETLGISQSTVSNLRARGLNILRSRGDPGAVWGEDSR